MPAMPETPPTAPLPTFRFTWSHPAHAIALSGGLGLARVWPGTVGSLGGVALALPLVGAPWSVVAVVFVATFVLGVWAGDVTGRALDEDDAQCIVFDETWAAALTFVAIPAGPVWWLAGFFAFRFFDIVKPQPIRAVQDRLHGGLGVMADDLAAGLAAIAVVDVVAWALRAVPGAL